MRILFCGHLYLPDFNCGSETTMHAVLKHFQSQGHEVRVVLHKRIKKYIYDGIEVCPLNGSIEQFMWADRIFTQLDYTQWTIQMGGMAQRPVIHFVHSDKAYNGIKSNTNIVYNSNWVKEVLNYEGNSMVFTPLLDQRFYEQSIFKEEREFITLINLNENKGGYIFAEIAKQMPDKKFLGVKGTYGDQTIPIHSNMTILENTLNIIEVYKKTRIILIPSEYESWSCVAQEAMSYSIPVINSGTEGLKENCDKAGIYIKDRNNIDEWIDAIKKLDKDKMYQSSADRSFKRSQQLKPNFEQLEQFVYNAQL